MAKNDTILLDGIINQRIDDSLPSKDKGEVFEYFAFEQILKDYDLSRDEIDQGWVDGRDDGGIDGLFLFVNGTIVIDSNTFVWPRAGAVIELFVVTAKHHETFELKPVDSLCATAQEFFDLSVDRADLKASYAKDVLQIRSLFAHAYQKLAIAKPTVSIKFIYVSRGDTTTVDKSIKNRANQVVSIAREMFSSATCQFDFLGASDLITKYRKEKSFTLSLPVSDSLASSQSGYVVLARIDDYSKFVTDETGALRRYLFDSNVRDFLGTSQVNLDILESLKDPCAAEFWWLNNGVTILTTNATMAGKNLLLENIQIVNGLQTTETIFQYCHSTDYLQSNRCVLVKAIVSTETFHRDQIIRATNNQNVVDTAGLRATDKVQRDIEEFLERHAWYYERRKNYYKNIGKPAARFVTPLYLASGFTAIILKQPFNASRQKSKFMRNELSYRQIFSEQTPLACWLVIVEVMKRVEAFLHQINPKKPHFGSRIVSHWRCLMAFLSVARALGRFSYNDTAVANLDPSLITTEVLQEIWGIVGSHLDSSNVKKADKKASFMMSCCSQAAQRFGIEHIQSLNRDNHTRNPADRMAELGSDFVEKVRTLLPPKPWGRSFVKQIARTMNCDLSDIYSVLNYFADQRREESMRLLAESQLAAEKIGQPNQPNDSGNTNECQKAD